MKDAKRIRHAAPWRRAAAFVWLAVVIVAAGYLGWRLTTGVSFRADLMALVPQESRDPAAAKAEARAIGQLSKRVVFLVGHSNRNTARIAAQTLSRDLKRCGLMTPAGAGLDAAGLKAIGTVYFPYRHGLLSASDRALLQSNQGAAVAERALAQAYGVGGVASAGLLANDPFLLMPDFLAAMPVPQSALRLDDGLLSTDAGGKTWVLVSGTLTGEPYALDAQKAFAGALSATVTRIEATAPGLTVLKTGAVFYATAGAQTAMAETSIIGVVALFFTVLLLIFAFRSPTPLLLSLSVIAVGLTVAMAFSLWFWGSLHVLALLFGVSLIGVTVDYSLQYFGEIYVPDAGNSWARLKKVFIGISMGAAAATTCYLLLLLAPFPGLRQIALFSAVGLVSAWLTVVLWLPQIDRMSRPRHTMPLAGVLARVLGFWQDRKTRPLRLGAMGLLIVLCALGAFRLHADDDVHNMQALSAPLLAEQKQILHLTGAEAETRFFVVSAANEETTLRAEETLAEHLNPLIARGNLRGFQSVAGYVPSLHRQAENRMLVLENLYRPHLATLTTQLGLSQTPPQPPKTAPGLTPDQLGVHLDALELLRAPNSDGSMVHIVSLEGVKNTPALSHAADGIRGVRLVDPARDYSTLFGKYRVRALALLAASALAMFLLLSLRYGFVRTLAIQRAPLVAVAATPFLCALMGASFTFFDVIALVLVLAMGTDYAVFFAETNARRKASTLFAIVLSAATTIMSFGFLAFSSMRAVHNFGLTMFVGISLALALIPAIKERAP